jgi:glycosyltransferase involved in cell wall biosynthesis
MTATATVQPDRATSRPRIAMVVTRDLDEPVSRVGTIQEIRSSLEKRFDVTTLRLYSIVERRGPETILSTIGEALSSLATLRPLALQCLLYSDWKERRRILAAIRAGGFDAVYVDSIRCFSLIQDIRRAFPALRIVADFDDLLSRRLRFLLDHKLPLGLGFLRSSVPHTAQYVLNSATIAGLITRYEASVLPRIETRAAEISDAVVLVSAVERDALRERLDDAVAARIVAICPPAKACAEDAVVEQPFRFVFVGSDRQLQNELSIQYLIDKWRTLHPSHELHIYGRQFLNWPKTPGVIFHGFVTELSEAYDKTGLVLVPTFRLGGIKTKLLEAWAHGRPVLANPMTFEGVSLKNYPLNLPEGEWDGYLTDPQRHAGIWADAARLGRDFVHSVHSVEQFGESWCKVIDVLARPAKTIPDAETSAPEPRADKRTEPSQPKMTGTPGIVQFVRASVLAALATAAGSPDVG